MRQYLVTLFLCFVKKRQGGGLTGLRSVFSQDQLCCKVHHSGPMVTATIVEGLEEGRQCLKILGVHTTINRFAAPDVSVGLIVFPVLMEHFNHVRSFHDLFTERPVQYVLVGIPEDCNPFPCRRHVNQPLFWM